MPYTFYNKIGKLVSFDSDLGCAIADNLDIKAKFIEEH